MHKPLILLIDRCPETRSMYAHYFRYKGYRVVHVDDGEEVLGMCPGMRPALVITELPEDAGSARALRQLRWPEAGGKTPIIACSTLIDRWWRAPEGLDVDVALPKPTTPRDLLLAAERLLTRGPATDPAGSDAVRAGQAPTPSNFAVA